jgi:hypothetical protein
VSNEAFARVKIDALLAAQGWDTQDANAVRFEVMLPDGIDGLAAREAIGVFQIAAPLPTDRYDVLNA